MNQDISTFLTAGRKFRVARAVGPVLLVEKDPQIREIVESWILRQGPVLISCSTIVEAEAFLAAPVSYVEAPSVSGVMRAAVTARPTCVIISMDGQCHDATVDLLHRIDREYLSTIAVAVTEDRDLALSLAYKLPRVTFIFKGEGLGETLKSLFLPNGEAKA